jgi:recombination endonuclease VII
MRTKDEQKQYYQDNKERINEKNKKYKEAHKEEIREKSKKYYKKYYENNKEKIAIKSRKWHRKRLYGVTQEEFDCMLVNQENKCAICRRHLDKPFVDHDHTTKKVRELLCGLCNAFIGQAREDSIILMSAIQYLKKHKEQNNV